MLWDLYLGLGGKGFKVDKMQARKRGEEFKNASSYVNI
jgi:hypothetical protein